MTNISELTVQIKLKWWMKWYVTLCYILRMKPSAKTINKGIYFKGGKV